MAGSAEKEVVITEGSFNMTRGRGGGGMKILIEILAARLLLVLKYTNFRSPPPS